MHFMRLFWELDLFFGLFPFKGSAYGRIRKSLESGLGPTAHRHWSLFGPPKSKVHTDFGRFSSESPADEIDSLPPVFDSARRAGRLLLLYAILWPPPDGLSRLGRSRWPRSRAMAQEPPGIRFPGSDVD